MKRTTLISIIGLIAIQALSGCTSSTRGSVNKVAPTTPAVSQTLMAPEQKGLKRVVAISRFSDETKRTNSFLVDNNGDRLGKQAADILSSRLTETNKFIMLERQELEDVQAENVLSNTQLEKVGADYLIVGSVSEFGRSTNSEVGVFSRNKIQTASATVNVRLINTKTGQIVYSEEASGEARTEANRVLGVGETAAYDTSLDDRAISAAISKLVSNIIENLMDAPWQAYLISEQNGQYLMTGGADQGIEIGDEFALLTKGKQMKNPQTGMMIELPGKQIATITVTGFMGSGQNAISITEIVNGSIGNNTIEQLVVREIKE